MLSIITGSVGSGKTEQLMQRLTAHVKSGGRAVLIVPEQASFMAERDVYTALGILSPGVRVASFTRLSEQVIKETGSAGILPLDTPGRCLLVATALDEVADLLTVYRRSSYTIAFVSDMVDALDELRCAGITPYELSRIAGRSGTNRTGSKLSELAVIMDAYEALMSGHFTDGADVVALAAGKLSGWEGLSRSRVFIDSFAGFTSPEYRVIEAMLLAGCHVDVTLSYMPDDGRYEIAAGTLVRLRALSDKLGLGKPSHQHISQSVRYQSDEVAMVAEEALATPGGKWARPGRDVSFHRASTPYDELVFLASEISRLVREEGYRYRDITVMTRDAGRYTGHLRPVFGRYDIPLFVDMEEQAASKLLPSLLQAALDAACGREGISPFIKLAKCPAVGIDQRCSGEFENYCFVWSIKPRDLKSPLTRPVDGFADSTTEIQAARLEQAESCRMRVCGIVDKLRVSLSSGTAAGCAKGLYQMLEDIQFGENIAGFSLGMPEEQRRDFLDEQAQLWDGVIGIIDLFGSVMGDMPSEPERFAELFMLCVASLRVAMPPRTLDQVTFGAVDRIRPDNPKAVFLIGAVEGEFPRSRPPERLLGEAERVFLGDEGYSLIKDSDYLLALEEYNCLLALGGPSHRLYLSYPAATAKGEALEPSVLYQSVMSLFAQPKVVTLSEQETVSSVGSALMALGACEGSGLATALRSLLSDRGMSDTLKKLDAGASRAPRRLSEFGGRIFDSRTRLSPSRIERYFNCPFQHFIRDAARIRPRRKAQLSPLEGGTLVHEVLSVMIERYGGAGLADLPSGQIDAEAQAAAREFIAARVGGIELMDDRISYLTDRLAKAAADLVRMLAEEFSQSLFRPVASELVVGDGGVRPLSISLPDGRIITVEGRADRVDIAQVEGVKYLRVVDYKSGGKRFSLSEVCHGLNMQMLIYLFALWQNGEGELGGALPAGVLYMPVTRQYLRVDRDAADEKIKQDLRATYRMNGLILNDPLAILSMDPSGRGVFVPRPTDRGAQEQLATLAEMGRLKQLVEQRVSDMAQSLMSGAIEAWPLLQGSSSPCDRCDYRGVCGFEEGDQVRIYKKLPRDVVLGDDGDGEN